MNEFNRIRFLVAGSFALAAAIFFAIVAAIPNREIMRICFVKSSYYIILGMFLVWTVMLVRYFSKINLSFKQFLARNWKGLCLTLALMGAVFMSVKPGYRVLSDETNLLGVSRSMLFEHTVQNPTMGFFYYGNLQVTNYEKEKRPFLFPFLLSIVHLVLGYKWTNLFVLNFLVGWSFLFMFYRVFEPRGGLAGGLAASVLLASYPIFTLNATGGGFDLLAAFFMALALLMVWIYLHNPEKEELNLLWMTLLMLANTRYESFIYLPVIFALLFAFRRVPDKKRVLLLSLVSVPFFFPIAWQRILTAGNYEHPAGTTIFSVSSLSSNLRFMLNSQFDFTFKPPYNNIINLAAFLCIIWLVIPAAKKLYDTRLKVQFAAIAGGAVGLNVLINCAHFFVPSYAHPVSARWFIGFSAACVFMVSVFLVDVFKVKPWFFLILSLALFSLYHPTAMERRFPNCITMIRATDYVYDFLAKADDRNLLVVTDRPGQYVVADYGAISFKYANSHVKETFDRLRRHLCSHIVILQDIRYDTGRPIPEHTLSKEYPLEPLAEIQNTAEAYVRISKVVLPE
ncbi:MAG: glycosyltransferase family 39 protein [Elusimicrobiaceae bacterium]|nr:glycosyltransferase family 39 protein [Elusimicrobiaceae bacterium]